MVSLQFTREKNQNKRKMPLSFLDVCALRLDFETFTTSRGTTAAPTEDLTCGDVFTITVKSYRLFLDNEAAFFNRRHLKTISEQ